MIIKRSPNEKLLHGINYFFEKKGRKNCLSKKIVKKKY